MVVALLSNTPQNLLSGKAFYFIRHGQSQANAEGTPAGTFDTPLTALGEREALLLRPVIESLAVRPSKIFTSNLQRAKRTAAIINENMHLPMEEERLLEEQNYGDCQGVPKEQLVARFGNSWSLNPPNGERFEDFTARMVRALEKVLAHPSGIPMIVGHGGMAHALGRLYNINLRGVKNCVFLHFKSAMGDSGSDWHVIDHEGNPFDSGVTNMGHE